MSELFLETSSSSQDNLSNISILDRLNFAIIPGISENFEEIKKLEELRNDIGDKLFNLLSDQDKRFIFETEGSIDLGHNFTEKDFKRVEKSLREDYEY